MTTATALAAIMIVAGLVGVVVPVLPGLLLVWGGVLVWALALARPAGWAVLAVATALVAAGTVLKYLLPGRRLRESGVPGTTIMLGAVLGVVGFFVVPVVGLPIGFVAGIYLAELGRVGGTDAWPSTRQALAAVGVSILIEFASGLLVAGVWLVGLAVT